MPYNEARVEREALLVVTVKWITGLILAALLAGCEVQLEGGDPSPLKVSDQPQAEREEVGEPYDYAKLSLPPEQLRGKDLGAASPHWVWVMDPMLNAMPDGRAYLIDGAAGRFIGMLSTGYSFVSLSLPSGYDWIYSAETYYSRHTRGDRTDVVSVYDVASLSPVQEIVIPTKRASTIPRLSNAGITDDSRFMAVFNFTPVPSLSIIDLSSRSFVHEAQIPGCAMVYPTGNRQMFSLCGDGRILVLNLDDSGTVTSRMFSDVFYSLDDPITESGVRYADSWIFVSADGVVHEVQVTQDSVVVDKWLLSEKLEDGSGWWIGGMQHLTVHESRGELYSIMHEGDSRDYEAAGAQVWVYDIEQRVRTRVLELQRPANSILVTQDEAPLLFALPLANELDVYDSLTGTRRHTVTELGLTPVLMATPMGAKR